MLREGEGEDAGGDDDHVDCGGARPLSDAGENLLGSIREDALSCAARARASWSFTSPPSSTSRPSDASSAYRSQRFAKSFGFGLAAVQSWEQGRRRPEGPARVLLKVIEHDPEAVRRSLAA